jgi:hypothetical protein
MNAMMSDEGVSLFKASQAAFMMFSQASKSRLARQLAYKYLNTSLPVEPRDSFPLALLSGAHLP